LLLNAICQNVRKSMPQPQRSPDVAIFRVGIGNPRGKNAGRKGRDVLRGLSPPPQPKMLATSLKIASANSWD